MVATLAGSQPEILYIVGLTWDLICRWVLSPNVGPTFPAIMLLSFLIVWLRLPLWKWSPLLDQCWSMWGSRLLGPTLIGVRYLNLSTGLLDDGGKRPQKNTRLHTVLLVHCMKCTFIVEIMWLYHCMQLTMSDFFFWSSNIQSFFTACKFH